MKKAKKDTTRHYIDNSVFLTEITAYRNTIQDAIKNNTEKPQVPEYIGECFIKIANQLAFKSNFINYSFRDDMILDAIENCLTYIDNFDPDKSNNPFASGLASSMNITVNAIDGEGAARAVAKVLNSSASRSNPALNYQAVKAAAG